MPTAQSAAFAIKWPAFRWLHWPYPTGLPTRPYQLDPTNWTLPGHDLTGLTGPKLASVDFTRRAHMQMHSPHAACPLWFANRLANTAKTAIHQAEFVTATHVVPFVDALARPTSWWSVCTDGPTLTRQSRSLNLLLNRSFLATKRLSNFPDNGLQPVIIPRPSLATNMHAKSSASSDILCERRTFFTRRD